MHVCRGMGTGLAEAWEVRCLFATPSAQAAGPGVILLIQP